MKKSIAFVLFCVTCFCIFYGVRYVENPVETMAAVTEVYENKIDTSGYIVRTEQVYTAPAEGRVYHYIDEGTRVRKNSVLSTVYAGDVSEDALRELNNINARIAELKNSGGYTVSGSSGGNDIDNIRKNIINDSLAGSAANIENYKMQINSVITGDAQGGETESVETLEARKQALEAGLSGAKNDIYSQMAGVFSKNVDGLEDTLTPQNIKSYKIADYNAVAEEAKNTDDTAAAGRAVCKVVNNHMWYVMLTADRQTADGLKIGQNVKLRFEYLPGIEAEASVEYISTEDSNTDKNVVVLKCDQYKEGAFSIRFSKIELILESYEGYRVPVSAIRVNDGTRGVIVKNGATQVFKPCTVIYSDLKGQTAIIKPASGTANLLREYDNIMVGEK